MKRLLAFLLTALLLIGLAGCKTAFPTPTSPDTIPITSTTEPTESTQMPEVSLQWNAQYIRTDGNANVMYPSVRIVSSLEALINYYDTWHNEFDLDRKDTVYADTTIGFLDACDRYDEAFFAENYLIFVLLEEASGSIRHEVRSVEQTSDQKISISIDREVPEIGTDDIAQWHIMLELNREYLIDSSIDTYLYVEGFPSYTDDQVEPTPTEPAIGNTRDIEYTEQWLDPETATEPEYITIEDIIITRIYSNCFFATTVIPFPYQIKVNGQLSEEWCAGDQVYCTYKNIKWDEHTFRIEADLVDIDPSYLVLDPNVCYKPVIYLYPEQETEVSVKLQLDGKLTCTYPAYNTGWKVTAAPDGTLTDAKGQTYNYLYWEGETNTQWDLSKGFCVKGEDTAAFLEEALAKLGLNRKEANEFIVFWLPLMEQNPYNIIAFQTDVYTDYARLEVKPTPDTTIRVFMTWKATDGFVDMPEQELTAPDRNGFTVIEWGGTQLP